MIDFIIATIIVVIVGAAAAYIVKEKKRGVKCIGCSASGACSGKCNGTSGCGSNTDAE